MAEVSIEKLTKSYDGSVKVLDGVDLRINQGELVFLLGPSGCGKSTLLRILAGLVTADSGTISFDGKNIMALPPEKRRAAMVFQNYALWPHLNVFENIEFGLKIKKMPPAERAAKVKEMLALVGLVGFERRRVEQLSGGQQQRVAIARALVNRLGNEYLAWYEYMLGRKAGV